MSASNTRVSWKLSCKYYILGILSEPYNVAHISKRYKLYGRYIYVYILYGPYKLYDINSDGQLLISHNLCHINFGETFSLKMK